MAIPASKMDTLNQLIKNLKEFSENKTVSETLEKLSKLFQEEEVVDLKVKIEMARRYLLPILQKEENFIVQKISLHELIYNLLIELAKLYPLNDSCPITQIPFTSTGSDSGEVFLREDTIHSSTGHIFCLSSLIEYHNVREYKGSLFQELHNSKHLFNPITNSPFGIYDVVHIVSLATKTGMIVEDIKISLSDLTNLVITSTGMANKILENKMFKDLILAGNLEDIKNILRIIWGHDNCESLSNEQLVHMLKIIQYKKLLDRAPPDFKVILKFMNEIDFGPTFPKTFIFQMGNSQDKTALILACEHNNYEAATELLKAGALINIKDSFRRTALTYAALVKNAKLVSEIITAATARAKQDSTAPDKTLASLVHDADTNGETPLSLACRHADIELVLSLLKASDSVNPLKNPQIYQFFMNAIKDGNYAAVSAFMSVSSIEFSDPQPFICAIQNYMVGILQKLLEVKNRNAIINFSVLGQTLLPLTCEQAITADGKNKEEAIQMIQVLLSQTKPRISYETVKIVRGNKEIISLFVKMGADVSEALMHAVETNDVEAVSFLVAAGMPLNVKPSKLYQESFLMLAIRIGNAAIISALLGSKDIASIINDSSGYSSALSMAYGKDNVALVTELISAGATLMGAKTIWGTSLLHGAINDRKVPMVLALLNARDIFSAINQLEMDHYGFTPFELAVRCGVAKLIPLLIKAGAHIENNPDILCLATDIECAKALLNVGISVFTRDQQRCTPLLKASISKNYALVDFFNSHIYEVSKAFTECKKGDNAVDLYGRTRLMYCILQRDKKGTIEALTNNSRRYLNKRDYDGRTALMMAAENGEKETVEAILSVHAMRSLDSLDASDNAGHTALMLACKEGHVETASILLSAGASVKLKNYMHETAFMLASATGNIKLMSLLFDRGADINNATDDGHTALSLACIKGDENIAVFLLRRGASIFTKNYCGRSPLMHASMCGKAGITKMLLDAGAGITISDKDDFGHTALEYATDRLYGCMHSPEIIALLETEVARRAGERKSDAEADALPISNPESIPIPAVVCSTSFPTSLQEDLGQFPTLLHRLSMTQINLISAYLDTSDLVHLCESARAFRISFTPSISARRLVSTTPDSAKEVTAAPRQKG